MTMLPTFMRMGDINTLFKLSLGLAKLNFETRTASFPTRTTSNEMKQDRGSIRSSPRDGLSTPYR